MLPEFPRWTTLTLDDRDAIARITRRYAPYSDFNFTSLWSWNAAPRATLSLLHGNLVIQCQDYAGGEPFISVLGNRCAPRTLRLLLAFAQASGAALRLVPRISLAGADWRAVARCSPDRDHFDYVYRLSSLAHLHTSALGRKRRAACAFARERRPAVICPSLDDDGFRAACLDLFARWQAALPADRRAGVAAEYAAFQRCFALGAQPALRAFGVLVQGDLVAYCLTERLGTRFCLAHFGKADHRYRGCAAYLYQQVARAHLDAGDVYLNIEQDLGVPGLRSWKEGWQPLGFLRKYTATPLAVPDGREAWTAAPLLDAVSMAGAVAGAQRLSLARP